MRHGVKTQAKSRSKRALMPIMLAAALMAATACTEVIRNHGYIPLQESLDGLTVGVDTRGSVEDLIGKPSSSGVLRDGDWFYVGSRMRHYAWKKPQETDRQVLALRFDGDTLANIERFGLENGRVVTLSRRVTETTVRDATFIRQIIRNFRNINLGEALGG